MMTHELGGTVMVGQGVKKEDWLGCVKEDTRTRAVGIML